MLLSDDPELLDAVLTHFNLNYFPRSIGNPRQKFVYASEEVWQALQHWEGDSCFISTCGYDDFTRENGKTIPRKVVHSSTFLDFDHKTKPENALADSQRVSQFLRQHNIAHWVQFSGSKGYHVHIMHKPVTFRFHWSDGSADALKAMIYQFQDHLRQTLGLNTMDESTMGDAKRLCRIPFTLHPKTGLFATPIDPELLDGAEHSVVAGLARTAEVELPVIRGELLTLPETIGKIGMILERPEAKIRPIIDPEVSLNSASAKRFIASLGLNCPGVVNELKRRNPGHKARVYAAIHAKLMGYSVNALEAVWLQLAASCGYVDASNTEHRLYQMGSIINNPSIEMFPTCTTLKANGCCIGDTCPKYVDMDNGYTPRTVKRQWRRKSANGEGVG